MLRAKVIICVLTVYVSVSVSRPLTPDPCAVLYLASSHPVAFVQSKLPQSSKALLGVSDGGPPHHDPQTPKVTLGVLPAQCFKVEQTDTVITTTTTTGGDPGLDSVTFEPSQDTQTTTISSDALHALVEQLRPSSPPQSVQEIVIIQTLDNAEAGASMQQQD